MTTRLDAYNDLHRWVNDEMVAMRARIAELEVECHAAFRYAAETPCDPETTTAQAAAWHLYRPFYVRRRREEAEQMDISLPPRKYHFTL